MSLQTCVIPLLHQRRCTPSAVENRQLARTVLTVLLFISESEYPCAPHTIQARSVPCPLGCEHCEVSGACHGVRAGCHDGSII